MFHESELLLATQKNMPIVLFFTIKNTEDLNIWKDRKFCLCVSLTHCTMSTFYPSLSFTQGACRGKVGLRLKVSTSNHGAWPQDHEAVADLSCVKNIEKKWNAFYQKCLYITCKLIVAIFKRNFIIKQIYFMNDLYDPEAWF